MKPQAQAISTGDRSKVADNDAPARAIAAEQDDSMPARLLNDNIENAVIESKSQLVEYLESGCKPRQEFRLGTEQEQFVYRREDFSPAAYDDGQRPGIKAFLQSMLQFGWEPIDENGQLIALERSDGTITLEPGGQIELSGVPLRDVHQIQAETRAYHRELRAVASTLGLSFLAIGHQPKHAPEELPWMPKQRYKIMRAYMPKRGSMGLDMMQSTCSTQVTADFCDEADMVKKFRVSLALQPVAEVLFANSPFAQARKTGFLSYRSKVWADTDPQRCGSLPFAFQRGMGFERYTDYVLDVPMYFVTREGQYIDASGLSFRDFLAGRLAVLPGQRPMLSDWVNHLSTVFPQVRLKRQLEMRGADAGDAMLRVPALAALWAGLLYDVEALDTAFERICNWTPGERHDLAIGVAKYGFRTPFREGTVRDLALWMLDLSRKGLERRDYLDEQGLDESDYLKPLQAAAEAGQTFAEELLYRLDQEWLGDFDTAIRTLCEETLS